MQTAKDLILNGEYKKAIDELKKQLDENPNNDQAWYYLSVAYSNLNMKEESESAILKAIELNGDEPEYLIKLCYKFYMKGDADKVREICNQILKIDPKFYEATRTLGALAKDEGDLSLAEKYLTQVLANVDDPDAALMLLEVYLDAGNLDNASNLLVRIKDMELDDEQLNEKNEYFVRFAMDKAMEGWTGKTTDEKGETLYFPETIDQIKTSEFYLEMAEEVTISDKTYIDRLKLLREVIETNKQKLQSSSNPEDTNRWFDSLSDIDRHAYTSLEKLFDLWTGVEEHDGIEYRYPKTVEDIKESDKALRTIGKMHIKDKDVKARYKELREVVSYKMKGIPNFGLKFVTSLIISIIAILALYAVVQFSKYKTPEFKFNQDDWVISENTDLVYDAFVGDYGKDKKVYKTLYAGTQLTPIARKGRWWIQVKTGDGSIGYVYYRAVKGAKNVVVDKTTPLLTDYKTKVSRDSVRKGEKLTVLGYFKEGKELHENIVKVRTASGKVGFVPYYRLDIPFLDDVPKISQTFIFPTTVENIEKASGKSIDEVAAKYGPVTSIIKKAGEERAFFNQLEFIKDGKKMSGVFFILGNDGKILNYEVDATKKVKFVNTLPLADEIRQAEPFDLLSFSFYESKDVKFTWWENFKAKNWVTKILGWIVQFIIGFLLIFLFFSIPRLIISPLMMLINHFRLLGNGMVLLINFLLYGFIAYIFFVWMALLMNQFFIAALLSLISFGFWWRLYRKNIRYNRCPSCHTMNVGLDRGSTYHGRSSSVTWGTYDVYKGTTETSTQIIHNYERRDKKTTTYTDHYTDHRECINCGYEWGVSRNESAGSETKHY
ncbi:MAG TPA: tetratricopeptide repeat protein [Tenuifilaceae bacterium]|nr:tetratricopeptide repeat protein [Tenuifilaceae bacterium]